MNTPPVPCWPSHLLEQIPSLSPGNRRPPTSYSSKIKISPPPTGRISTEQWVTITSLRASLTTCRQAICSFGWFPADCCPANQITPVYPVQRFPERTSISRIEMRFARKLFPHSLLRVRYFWRHNNAGGTTNHRPSIDKATPLRTTLFPFLFRR